MTQQIFGYISGILIILSFIPYIKDIFKHTTKPQRASWLIWAIIGLIAFFSQFAKGASDSLWLTGAQAGGDIFVFFLAIKYGMGGFEKRDKVALAGVAISLIFWYFTREPAVALFIVTFIDGIGAILTVIKSYESPRTESMSTWVLTAFSGLFGSLAVGRLNFVLLLFPVYICLVGISVTIAIKVGLKNGR